MPPWWLHFCPRCKKWRHISLFVWQAICLVSIMYISTVRYSQKFWQKIKFYALTVEDHDCRIKLPPVKTNKYHKRDWCDVYIDDHWLLRPRNVTYVQPLQQQQREGVHMVANLTIAVQLFSQSRDPCRIGGLSFDLRIQNCPLLCLISLWVSGHTHLTYSLSPPIFDTVNVMLRKLSAVSLYLHLHAGL